MVNIAFTLLWRRFRRAGADQIGPVRMWISMWRSRAWSCGWGPPHSEILSPIRTRCNTAIDGLCVVRACWDYWTIHVMSPSPAAQDTDMSELGLLVIEQNARLRPGPPVCRMLPVLMACGLILSTPAAAANQGAFAAASRGSITITASVAPRADFTGSAVWPVAGEEHSLLELRCLRLSSLTGGYRLSPIDAATGQPGSAAKATNEDVVAAGLRQNRTACQKGDDARWLIGQRAGSTAAQRARGFHLGVLLAPL